MMPLQTIVHIPPYPNNIQYKDPILLVGSCFSENVGRQLLDAKYQAMVNPFGVMYNPISVKRTLEIIMNNKPFSKEDLNYDNHLWFSYNHHSSFSKPHENEILELINAKVEEAHSHLSKSNFLFITFGTARIYRLKQTGQVVANCHKQPQRIFDHELLEPEGIVQEFDMFINQLKEKYPALNLIFTVSPVRHWKDGAIGNQVSKSTLILAIHKLIENHRHCFYFPSYEIFMDEMRDYRFYEEDMLHPSSIGKSYIWQRFTKAFLDEKERHVRDLIDKINRAYQHKPFFPDSMEYRQFAKSTFQKIDQLLESYPYLNLEMEKEYFNSILS